MGPAAAHPSIAIVTLVLCAFSVPAQAQTSDESYRQLIEQAVGEFELAHFPEARALFLRAHALAPGARTLRGIGMASFEMRDYVEAYRAFSLALNENERPLDDAQRAQVEALRTRTAVFVGIFHARMSPESASLVVDDTPATVTPDGRLVLPIGEHEVRARAAGHTDAVLRMNVRGGEDSELVLALEPREEPHEAPSEPAPERSVPIAGSDPRAGIALLIVGALASAGAIAVGLASWMTRVELIDVCNDPPPMMECENGPTLRMERDVAAGFTVGLALLGTGTAIAGAALFAVETGSAGTALACMPSGPGLVCAGRF